LGADVGGIRGAHRDICQGRRRERQCRFRDLRAHHRHRQCLAAVLLATGQFQAPGSISSKTYTFLALSGLATGASWACYFRALKLGDASRVAPIDKLSVVLVAVFAVIFLGERPSLPNWLGIALIALGAVLVAYRR